MRTVIARLLLLVLAGCQDRRTFDERYADTERNIEERAQRLDAKLNNDAVSSNEQQQNR